jgi:hypothetical protein
MDMSMGYPFESRNVRDVANLYNLSLHEDNVTS